MLENKADIRKDTQEVSESTHTGTKDLKDFDEKKSRQNISEPQSSDDKKLRVQEDESTAKLKRESDVSTAPSVAEKNRKRNG